MNHIKTLKNTARGIFFVCTPSAARQGIIFITPLSHQPMHSNPQATARVPSNIVEAAGRVLPMLLPHPQFAEAAGRSTPRPVKAITPH